MNLDSGEELLIFLCVLVLAFMFDSIFEKYFDAKYRRRDCDCHDLEDDDDQES